MTSYKIIENSELSALASPLRQRLLDALTTEDSASGLARRFDMSRQRIGYHMRDLEKAGCIEAVGTRQQRGLTEKLYRARPIAFVHSPPGIDTKSLRKRDRFSWAALVNLLARSLGDLITLRRNADKASKRLATLALEADLNFESPGARMAFTEDLLDAVETVLSRHETPASEKSRHFRLVLGAYPSITREVHQ